MSEHVEFTVPGKLQQERKRSYRRGKFTTRVDVPEAADFKTRAASYALQAMRDAGHSEPFDAPLLLEVTWYRPKPKSWPKSRNLPTTKPDLSNYTKLLEDALNGIVYQDDARIVTAVLAKRFDAQERVEVRVSVITGEEA